MGEYTSYKMTYERESVRDKQGDKDDAMAASTIQTFFLHHSLPTFLPYSKNQKSVQVVIPPLGGPPSFVVYPNDHGQDFTRDTFPNIFACFI